MNKKQCNLNNRSIDLYEIVVFNEIFRKSKILLNNMHLKKFNKLQSMFTSKRYLFPKMKTKD